MSRPSSWQELEKAFRKLPIRRVEAATGIPYEFFIPDIPRQLMGMVPNKRVRVVRTKQGLCSVPLSVLPTEEGLRRLAASTRRTVETLDSLSQDALDALNLRPAALRDLTIKVRLLRVAAELAGDEIAVAKKAKTKASRGRPSQVKPSPANKIAGVVAEHYRGLTGKIPTRYDKAFVHLLARVFEILGIKASAQSQAATLAIKTNRR